MGNTRLGVTSGLLAYVFWGVLGIFWELLHAVPALDTLAYRIVWSLVTIFVVLLFQNSWRTVWQTIVTLTQNRKILWIMLSGLLITVNWYIYIFMVTHNQATEASLGYYMMPLMNVAIAVLFLHERLSPAKMVALLLVVIGVVLLTKQTGALPLSTLLMAASFCLYSLIKKQVPLPATISLALETLCVAPFAAIYLLLSPHILTQNGPTVTGLIIASGAVTVVPLALFAVATKNTQFMTLGFIQYLNPTMQLLVAIFVLHEPLSWHKIVVFVFIWAGIAVFVLESIYQYQHLRQNHAALRQSR